MERDTTRGAVMRALRTVTEQSLRFSEAAAVRLGLSASDIETLEMLRDLGGTTAGRLAELTGLTTGAVTRMIDRLEQAGYVRRVADPSDRRRVIVEITPDKLAALGPVLDSIARQTATELSRYTEAQLALISEFLDRVGQITVTEVDKLREAPTEARATDLPSAHAAPLGGLSSARLAFRGGAPDVTLQADPDLGPELYRARFEGATPQVRVRDGVVSVHYPRAFFGWLGRRGQLTLNGSIPWSIQITGGANHLSGDLTRLDLREFDINGGANETRLVVGTPRGIVPIRIRGGMDKLRIRRPAGVAVMVRVSGGANRIDLDGRHLAKVGGQGETGTPGYEKAVDRYDLEIVGGASRITIE